MSDILCSVCSNVCAKEIVIKIVEILITIRFLQSTNLNKQSIKWQSYDPKSTKIDSFKQNDVYVTT